MAQRASRILETAPFGNTPSHGLVAGPNPFLQWLVEGGDDHEYVLEYLRMRSPTEGKSVCFKRVENAFAGMLLYL